jgi:hypothetical protein
LRFHDGGSEVFLRGAPVPSRGNAHTLEVLLEQPGVVAVVRQDSGRALLVVRELGDSLVFDHFAYPGVDPEVVPLLPWIDDAQVEARVAALALPERKVRPLLDPREGTLVELDRVLLDRVDRGAIALSHLRDRPYREKGEVNVAAPAIFDRVAVAVPFGHDGRRARLRGRLGLEGTSWLAPASQGQLSEHLRVLSESDVEPQFEFASADPGFVLRGKDIDIVWFRGGPAFAHLLGALEQAASSNVQGSIDSFAIEIPSGPLPSELGVRGKLGEVRERLTLVPHRLEGRVVADTVELDIGPR